jgi:hypothetical protein
MTLNNAAIYDSVLAGVAASNGAWLSDSTPNDYQSERTAAEALATEVDSAISTILSGVTLSQRQLVESIVKGVMTGRTPQSVSPTDYSKIANGIAAVFTEFNGGLTDNNPDNIVYVGPPVDGISDDWAAINAVVQDAPEGSIITFLPSQLPYICNSTTIVGRSNITLDFNGAKITSTSAYGLRNIPIIAGVQTAPPVIGTLNGAVAEQATTIVVTYSSSPLVKDDYFYIDSDRGGRQSYQVLDVDPDGVTIHLDWPVLVKLDNGSTIRKFTPIQNFKVLLNGAYITHTFYGTYTDARWIYEAVVWNCTFAGPGTIRIYGPTPPTAIVGFDIGGRGNIIENFTLIGTDGTNGNASGVGIEGQRKTVINNVRTFNIGYAVWINSCWNCELPFILSEKCNGAILATSISLVNESGCHQNRFGLIIANDMIGNNGGLDLQADTTDNTFDYYACTGSTPNFAAPAVIFGRNGTIGPSGNVFEVMNIKNLSTGFYTGSGSDTINNIVESLIVNGIQTLVALNTTKSNHVIRTLRGSIVPSEVNLIQLTGNATLDINDVSLIDGQLTFTQKKNVTLNAASKVFCVAPWANVGSKICLACLSAGGTSHGRPIASLIKNTTSVNGTALNWFNAAGLASWTGFVMTADAANSAHGLVYQGPSAFVEGPGIFRTTIVKTGVATWAALQLGAANVIFFNLITGAVGTVIGNASGYATLSAGGFVDIVAYSDDINDGNTFTIFMAQADNTLVSTMPGATFALSNVSINGLNAVSLVAEANNQDVYQVYVQ